MYLNSNSFDINRLVEISNKLWRSYSDSTAGGIS